MGSTIKSLDAFKQFSAVNTNISSANDMNKQNGDMSASTPAYRLSHQEKELQPSRIPSASTARNINPVIQEKFSYASPDDNEQKELKTRILSDDPLTKFKVEVKKTAKLPEYAYRGLKGDPDSNFYEYLNIANIPYFIGGPMLAAVFGFGMTRSNPQARLTAVSRTKQIAVGVVLYYLGVELAKKAIDIPVKLFRGVDLNHPYEKVVSCRATSKTGYSPKKIEYHKVPESIDFTNFALMNEDESKNGGKEINKRFDRLAKKFGIDKNIQESDDTLKGSIRKLIISATAMKYMLAAPFVATGVALAAQVDAKGNSIWGSIGKGFKNNIKNIFNPKSKLDFKQRMTIVKEVIKGNITTPMKESFKALWGKKGASNKIGRALILTSLIAPVLANFRVLQLTSEKDNQFVDVKEYALRPKKGNDNNQYS